MKLSLPLRIFLAHLVVMVALGGVTALFIKRGFEDYAGEWEKEVELLRAQQLYTPLTNEVARSLLLEIDSGVPEQQARRKSGIVEGLDEVLPLLGSIESLIIVNADGAPEYVHPSTALDLTLADSELDGFLQGDRVERRDVRLDSGEKLIEVVLPVFARDAGRGRRLGSVLIRYQADPRLEARLDEISPESASTVASPERVAVPMASEVARSLLTELEARSGAGREEETEAYKRRVSDGLKKLLRPITSIKQLVIVDRERRIQYISTPQDLDLAFTGDKYASLFASAKEVDRPIERPDGEVLKEFMLPVYDPASEGKSPGERRRLGSVLVVYRPEPGLAERIPDLGLSTVPRARTESLILFLAVTVGGGILLAALSGLPVRRLERALGDFRDRGFKGGIDPKAVGMDKDLASTVRAINELGGRLEALDARGRERDALLSTLSQSLEEGMIALDPGGVPVAWNPAAARLFLGESTDGGTGDESRALDTEVLRAALERNPDLRFAVERVDAVESREVEILRGDGSRVPAQVTAVSFEMRPEETGTLVLLRDLATLRKVEGHLLEAGRFAVLAHLAAGLAHEIRNPLHSIRLNATVVEQYAPVSSDDKRSRAVAESLTTIKGETERLADLLNNYLGMVRPEKESASVDIRELCRRVIQLVSYTARRSNVEIRLEGQAHPPIVRGVPDRLQQAILNLVLNALQAMPDGGVLSLRTSSSGDVVRLTVSDTGPGLDPELADQLFDTRVTTKPGGTGLGLPLVRMIAEAHGGSVWYRSTPPQGARFTLVLPTDAGR